MEPNPSEPTKTCPGCGRVFSLREILHSVEVEPIGMQLEDTDHRNNFYYFNHACPSCGSTFLVPVLDFLPFISEPVPDLTLTGTESCERHCLRVEDLAVCNAPCRYAPFRRFLLEMRNTRAVPAGAAGSSPSPQNIQVAPKPRVP